jgi:hypothetical protein
MSQRNVVVTIFCCSSIQPINRPNFLYKFKVYFEFIEPESDWTHYVSSFSTVVTANFRQLSLFCVTNFLKIVGTVLFIDYGYTQRSFFNYWKPSTMNLSSYLHSNLPLQTEWGWQNSSLGVAEAKFVSHAAWMLSSQLSLIKILKANFLYD